LGFANNGPPSAGFLFKGTTHQPINIDANGIGHGFEGVPLTVSVPELSTLIVAVCGALAGILIAARRKARPDQPEDIGSNLGRQVLPAFDHFGAVSGKKCGQGVGKRFLM
jgi:hypothetical protein